MAIVRNILDSRIKDCADIQSFKQYDDKYIGESGYFSDSLCRFQDLNSCYKYTLTDISDSEEAGDFIFECKGGNYRFFLPEKLVKEPEKKYKAYTLAEWIQQHPIGEVICFRHKSTKMVCHHMYMGYEFAKGTDIKEIGIGRITLGYANYSLGYLFENYEIEINGKWRPFGIKG